MDLLYRFKYLLRLYQDGNISVAEQDELFDLIETGQFDDLFARQIESDLHHGFEGQKADLPPHISQEIVRNILSAEKMNADIIPIKRKNKSWSWIAAASLLIVVVSSYFLLFTRKDSGLASVVPANSSEIKNTGSSPKLIVLSDGSHITLEPQSTLYYPKTFSDSVRDVYLDGKAFFEVIHNPHKPFLVYSNHIVTKVLGTSFFVNTHTASGNEEVSVKTGRVQVFEDSKLLAETKPVVPIIITPNQKAIYQPGKRLFETTLVDQPQPLTKKELGQDTLATTPVFRFIYEQEKLENIFDQLRSAYGIEIIPENPNLNNCVFTGDLSSDDLFNKLKILCLTTQSSYEINGTRILMKGRGCEKN